MMISQTKEYTWKDIEQLIYKDCGLTSKEDQKQYGQICLATPFDYLELESTETHVTISMYTEPYKIRIEKHRNKND